LPLGILAGSGAFLAVSLTLPTAQVYSYGWRILFYIGFAAAVVGVIIRLRLEESPLFKEVEEKRQILSYPASRVWREKITTILHLSMLNAGIGAASGSGILRYLLHDLEPHKLRGGHPY